MEKKTIEDKRLLLHEELCTILGSRHVYYDPPANITMKYPAIVYTKSRILPKKANNKSYLLHIAYTITLIQRDDDSNILDRLLEMEYTSYDRPFVSDNLHHDVITRYI